MVFPREAPRAVEVMTAAAASSSSPSPPSHRSVVLRGKPRSRLPLPAFRSLANQRFLRCEGAGNGAPAPPSSTSPPTAPGPRRRPAGARDEGFERIRERLMDHLREAAGRIELPAVAHGEEEREEDAPTEEPEDVVDEPHAAAVAIPPSTPASTASAAPAASAFTEELPWNLRTRRSTPASSGRHHHPSPDSSPAPWPPSRLRSGVPERREAALRRRLPRFSVPLTKEEIDEDLYGFTGRLASRRPKKRPRAVQKQLDMLFPGLYLSEVTVDMYQVADPPPPPPS